MSWDGNAQTQVITRALMNEDSNYNNIDFKPIASLMIKYNHSNIKAMISPQNISKLIENAIFFKENGIKYIDFSLVRDNIWDEDSIKLFL